MNSKYSILSVLRPSLLGLLAIAIFSTCAKDKVEKRTTTLYAYEVDIAAETYSAGVLRYMQANQYHGNKLVSTTYYNNDQSIKGKEVYTYTDRDSLPEYSVYYGADDEISATYKFENKEGHQVQRNGYEGNSNKLLRQERYQYDTAGNRIKKIIFDSQNLKQRTFLFGHDTFGNERQMTILDYADKQIASEEYEIALIDDKNRWLEKWGYVGKEKLPKTFYRQSYGE